MKKLYAVIGDPIAHSMSPAMHNEWFRAYNMDAHYHALRVKRKDLADAVKGLKAIGIAGFNVTVPHKVAIIPFLDGLDPLAEAIGAVNTVKNENGRLIGYNTDGSGYLKGLLSDYPSIHDKKVLLIGAGGAARAIYFTMASEGVKSIDIANRTIEKAKKLRDDCPYEVQTEVLSLDRAEEKLEAYDCIIQTTSIGMAPDTGAEPLKLHRLKKDAFVSDIIYNPPETKFLRSAVEKGAKVQNGLNMFVYQGALAFEKWTGIFPDVEPMKQIVLEKLGGKTC